MGPLLAAIAIVLLLAAASQAARRARRRLPASVLVAGDSLAAGIGPALTRALAARGVLVSTVSVQGSSARDWRRELLSKALTSSPAPLVLMSLGTNDAVSPALSVEFAGNVRTLGDRLAAARREVIWLVPPKGSPAVTASLTQPQFDWLAPPAGLRLDATGHPLGDGYERWAASVVASFPE